MIFCVVLVMSFETFPCGSPEAESTEEPAPSLYVENSDEDPSRLLIKKSMDSEPSRLAETANIEDKIMNEDEIAQVNASGGERLKLNSQNEDARTKNVDVSARRIEGHDMFARAHWIRLNCGNPGTGPSHTLISNERQQHGEQRLNPTKKFEPVDRASVIIKRSKEQQEVDSDSDGDSQDASKMSAKDSLRCNENISGVEANEDGVPSAVSHSRAFYYNHNGRHEDVNKLQDKGNGRSMKNVHGEILRSVHGETEAVPICYMPAGAYTHMLAMPGSTGTSNKDNFVHAGTSEVKRFQQHMDYVSGKPEQQVPVLGSTVNSNDGNVYNKLQHSGVAGIQYVDRSILHAGGYAVIPGIGPVRVMDGMYYQGIPMGVDQSHFENFASVQSFISMGNVPAETAQQLSSSGSSKADTANQPSQDKQLNAPKSYSSPAQAAVSPASSLEERRSTHSPAVKSDSSSPAPIFGEDVDGKKIAQAKLKGKPKLGTGATKPEIKCEQCGKTFGSSSALAKHKLTHSDERKYVCSTCGKGFKRQDHLNGHMVTHRDKKPYECNYADCDKSYCDMRSLRRHLENHHAQNGAGISDSRTPGSGSPSLNCDDKPLPQVVNNERSDSPRNFPKLAKGRLLKDRSDHLQVSGYDSGRSSGRSTPGSTNEHSAPRERPSDLPLEGPILNQLRERNSDSFSSTTSEDAGANSGEQSVPEKSTDAPKTHSAVDLLKQTADRVKTQQNVRNGSEMWQERFQQQPPYMSYQQWYPVYPQDPRFVYQYHSMFPSTVYQMPVNPGLMTDPRQRMLSDSDTPTEITKTVGVSSHVTPSPSQEYCPSEAMQVPFFKQQPSGRHAGTPTDPTAVAVATAKEMGHYRYAGESYYGVHPQGTQWQQVRYDETTNTYNTASSMGNSKSSVLYGHSMTAENNGTSSNRGESDRIECNSRVTPFRGGKIDTPDEPAEKRQRMSEVVVSERKDTKGFSLAQVKPEDNNNEHDKGLDEPVFRNPAEVVTPRRKQRPRPEPLTIPPSASTKYHCNRPVSPMNRSRPCSPPYTPPPMLSPRSIYHVNSLGNVTPRLSASYQTPMTPSRLQLLSSHSHRSSDVTGEEEIVPFPEPKINVGHDFQAEVPPFAGPKENVKFDEHKATLVWRPTDEKKRSRRDEIESYLEMACSIAVLGGGSNKEYALHVLHRVNGNIKDAVKLLLCQKYAIKKDDPMYDYHYEGSVRWASRERQLFRQNFRSRGKEFAELQKDVGEKKTVFDCVEFYYHWKAAHPEAVRGRTRYIDSDSDEDYEDTSSETNSNPSFFECDFPQCNAKFVSRQALNGHIRVHGGSFMKPSEPKRKNRGTAGPGTNGSTSGHVVRKRKSPSPAPATAVNDLNNQGGPLPEFACKVCGRIFHKIKSRSAHMKTHVKRPEEDDKLAAKMAASKNH